MKTDNYIRLSSRYSSYKNFEVIIATLEQYYPELINFSVLEHETKHSHFTGSYFNFFDTLLEKLRDLYTPAEICRVVNHRLQNDIKLRKHFHGSLIFVPPVNGLASPQIGFHEKLATGTLKVGEALTHLDMLRSTFYLQRMADNSQSKKDWRKNDRSIVDVVSLSTVQISETERLRVKNSALMINFNRDPLSPAKWGVLDLRNKQSPALYCETPLLVSEMQEFEHKFRFPCPKLIGGTANNLASSGYTALAWLDQNITKAWHFDTNADFNALLGNYILASFVSDVDGVQYSSQNNEYEAYFTPALKILNEEFHEKSNIKQSDANVKTLGGYGLCRLVSISILGSVEGEYVATNDVAKTIQIMGEKKHSITSEKEQEYTNLAFRSNIPRFIKTIEDLDNVLHEEPGISRLSIPEDLDDQLLEESHKTGCLFTNTNPVFFSYVRRPEKERTNRQEETATAMVLTVFRAKAKKARLAIDLPGKFQLNTAEHALLCNLMQDNAHVTELLINDNQSLKRLKKELLPVFARNRWLAFNDYLPPMIDNYWQRAVNYWFVYLNQHHNVAFELGLHRLFKNCVQEMGLLGLHKVLETLRQDNQREFLEKLFGKNQPAFYLACEPDESVQYYEALINHLKKRDYFPFSQPGISYQTNCETQFIDIIDSIKNNVQVDRVIFTGCLKNPNDLEKFLLILQTKAQENKWTTLIVIPELDENLEEKNHSLHLIYSHLNNLITKNRHEIIAEKLIQDIKQVDQMADQLVIEECDHSVKVDLPDRLNQSTLSTAIDQLEAIQEGPWPMHRSGNVNLQLQQQQEVQQSRQIAVEQHKVRLKHVEETLTGEIVTYKTIDLARKNRTPC